MPRHFIRHFGLFFLLALGGLTSCRAASSPVESLGLQGKITFVSEQHVQIFGIAVRGSYGLYVLDLDRPDASQFVVGPGEDILAYPDWSPAGDRLVFYRSVYDPEQGYIRRIVLVDPVLNQEDIFGDAWLGFDPAWSPDGALIACVKGGSLALYDVETQRHVRDWETPGRLSGPSWSPDGEHIVFAYAPDASIAGPGAVGGIATLNVEDGTFTQLTFDDADISPAWGPDGRIAFVRAGDIYVMVEDGSAVIRLTNDGQNGSPAWSPDGQQIAFLSSRDEECSQWLLDQPPFCTNEIHVMNADGSDVQVLRQENEHIWSLSWGTD